MLLIYLVDISQNIKLLGVGLLILSFIFFVIGCGLFSESGFHRRGSDSFAEIRGVASILILSALVIAILSIVMIVATPSKESADVIMERLIEEVTRER